MNVPSVRAIVTGAARGLGACFALQLVRAGAAVAAGDINEKGLLDLKQAAAGSPGRLVTAALDVAQELSVGEFVQRAAAELGGVNVLVNNAGILRDGVIARPENGWIKKLPSAQWRQVLDVNLTGAFLMAREMLASVLKNGISPSVIINISSVTGAGNPGQSGYAASKAGLDSLTRTWALELAPFGVRVAGIAPGVVNTPILENITPEAMNQLLAAIPLGRIGTPEEIWLALKFILECEYFTGRTIEVDGGASY